MTREDAYDCDAAAGVGECGGVAGDDGFADCAALENASGAAHGASREVAADAMGGLVSIRLFDDADVPAMREVWNEVVRDGVAFPQIDELRDDAEARSFFAAQTATAVAEADGKVLGLYILHPNNVGRCGHIANTSYAVASAARGRHVGRALVVDSMHRARAEGFRVLQFNAVVASNAAALHLYETLGFARLGVIPGGFLNKDGVYEDIIPHVFDLTAL